MRALIIENYNSRFNGYTYQERQIVNVTELGNFPTQYLIYYEETMDFVPKEFVQILA